MKITFIYDALYPEVKGGVEKRIYELGKRLAKKHEVHWYTFKWWGDKEIIERDGIIVHGIALPKNLYSGDRRSIREAIDFSFHLLLNRLEKSDIIDCQEFPYIPCYSTKFHSLLSKSELIITWHEYWGEYWREYIGHSAPFGKFLENNLLKITNNHIVVSKLTLANLSKLDSKNFSLIPNGIDLKRIQKVRSHDVKHDAIFVGRLIKHKNIGFLLRSIKFIRSDYPDFTLGIIGDGPERKKLEKLVKELGIYNNVEFLGFLDSHEAVIEHIKSSKVLTFPSLREGFGIVVLEANASGIPVVTVNAPMNASKELIIPGKNGYISELNEKSFAEKILLAYENSRKMKRTCINIARKYDWDVIAKRLEKYYEGVLSEH
ncbi:glycosyltransferase family 4 protein [Thermococcus barophilus]|uniref:Uncharacterized protein n=1 Tax=Thermococcus barophilus (strain DSM 11836 / MP) TaxID=391623 RepID=F0LLZ7_THEBM|nr:glycosyltransferase family 4 protein [Thermococcus barophilus]ADT85096.1 hypothetical protein TERMP_02122 [Thermococcus barophilus MP]